MEEIINKLLSFSGSYLSTGRLEEVLLILLGIAVIALVAYCIFRLAVMGLKIVAFGAVIYFLLFSSNLLEKKGEPALESELRREGEIKLLSKQMSAFLDHPKSIVLSLLKDFRVEKKS